MKDMKKRIIALVLVVVMSVLSLASCGGSFNFAEEDLTAYADFDYAAFMDALQKLEIEDSDYTTNTDIREQKQLENIYDKVVAAIIKNSYESDRKTEGTLGDGDVLYFVYYAVDEKTGNVYYTSEMNESSITASSTKANHVINLGNVDDEDEFMTLIKENIAEGDIKDLSYNMITAAEIKAEAKDALLAEKADATVTEITEAQNAAIKVKAGQKLVISYTRTYKTTNEEGVESTTSETAKYEAITLDASNPFHAKFLEEKSVANVGGTLEVFDADQNKTVSEFKLTIDEVEYTYSKVSILWAVETIGQPIATFKYTPFDSTKKVTPDNLTSSGSQDLKDVELTYYVYASYALSAPSTEELDIIDVLVNIYGKTLTDKSFELFENEEYKNGDKKLADLAKEIAKIYGGTDETYYGEGTELKKLHKAHADAKEAGGSKPTTAQTEAINDALEALTKAQNAKAKEIFVKIAEAKKGEELAGTALFEEYREDIAHQLKEAYDGEIVDKVQTEIWELIQDSVTVKKCPPEVVEEFYEILYESYESEYYTGDYSKTQSNYNKYDSFEAYLIATLKVKNASEIEAAITKEAEDFVKPIIQIFVVAQACAKNGATEKVAQYIEQDITAGIYEEDEDIESAREEAKYFLIDDSYMKFYRKEVGRSYYRAMMESYGEINIRTGFQFNKLFYYLAATNLVMNEEEGEEHAHAEHKYITIDGVDYIDFKTVKYTIVEPSEDAEAEGDSDAK